MKKKNTHSVTNKFEQLSDKYYARIFCSLIHQHTAKAKKELLNTQKEMYINTSLIHNIFQYVSVTPYHRSIEKKFINKKTNGTAMCSKFLYTVFL